MYVCVVYVWSLSRYSEASVLSVCKALKEAFDPSATISEGLQVCLRAQDVRAYNAYRVIEY